METPADVVDPEILGSTPVIAATRVPVRVLFEYLEAGDSLDAFLTDFPSVNQRQAISVLEEAHAPIALNAHSA